MYAYVIQLQPAIASVGSINPFNASCSKLLLFQEFSGFWRSDAQSWALERPNVKNYK